MNRSLRLSSFKDAQLWTKDLVPGETVLYDTYKKSPLGNWPLQMAVRVDDTFLNATLVQNVTYTATLHAAAGTLSRHRRG